MLKRALVVGSAAITLIAACGVAQNADLGSAPAAQAGGPRVLEPSQLQSQVAGKPVAYLFTATGCTSCVREVQALQAAAGQAQAGQTVRFVGVDVVGDDSPRDLSRWLQASGLASPMFVWTIDREGSLVRKFGVTHLGSSVLLDSSGRVRFVNQTSTDPAVLAKQLAQLT